ncbi:POT family proton-dependent oligopeptide transporter [Kinneretia asaccharophila]|uniref:POT family proton-dependent oligopeptide transporter n=2 Tax=Roseateles asaccharophilus TaxID=582607 RepID=A0ABU2A8F1_9BURK|nr:POT family proton-dependent oligopeptide transporter [Roseateles asaccharophilus]
MWERFSFYGVRSLLVLYLVEALQYSRADALSVYGMYTGSAFFCAIFGGWLADRFLGQRRAVVLGMALMMAGHIALGLDQPIGLALGLLAVGTGLFKPTTTAMVGALYTPNDARRQSGYTVFYMGINIGAALSALIGGYLAQRHGWGYGFMAAAVGMAIGVVVFMAGWRWLPPVPPPAPEPARAAWTDASARRRIQVILLMSVVAICFYLGYEQAAGVMTLFVRDHVSPQFLGLELTAAQFLAVNPVLVILLAPPSARLLARLDWPEFRVQGLGMLILGVSFLLLQALQGLAAQGEVVPAWMMVGVIGVQTVAELLVVPIGLAVVSRYGPAGWGSTLMGAWMLAKATAGLLAGQLYGWLEPTGLSLYLVVTAISFAGGVLLLSVSGALRRYAGMGGGA